MASVAGHEEELLDNVAKTLNVNNVKGKRSVRKGSKRKSSDVGSSDIEV